MELSTSMSPEAANDSRINPTTQPSRNNSKTGWNDCCPAALVLIQYEKIAHYEVGLIRDDLVWADSVEAARAAKANVAAKAKVAKERASPLDDMVQCVPIQAFWSSEAAGNGPVGDHLPRPRRVDDLGKPLWRIHYAFWLVWTALEMARRWNVSFPRKRTSFAPSIAHDKGAVLRYCISWPMRKKSL
jgi:hypothetical protein